MSETAVAPRIVGVFVPESSASTVPDLIREALAFRDLGADVLDLDTTPKGAFAEADDDLVVLLAAGLVAADAEVSVTTTRARLAVIAADHGIGTIIDPSGGTADPEMPPALAELGAAVVVGPWRPGNGEAAPAPGTAATPLTGSEIEDRYTAGILRNIAALLDAGVRSERIRVDAGAGLGPWDTERWRMLNHLERLGRLGYPVLVPAGEDVLAAMVLDESRASLLDDAATALTILTIGTGGWAIRSRRVARIETAVQRIVERPAPGR